MTEAQFINTYKYLHLSFEVDLQTLRPKLIKAPVEMQEALNASPDLAVKMVLYKAGQDSNLLDMIKERACIQWSEGLSDSLYMTVLRRINPVEEAIEYEPASESYKEFRRKYGKLTEEEIENKRVPKFKKTTDWDMELKNATLLWA